MQSGSESGVPSGASDCSSGPAVPERPRVQTRSSFIRWGLVRGDEADAGGCRPGPAPGHGSVSGRVEQSLDPPVEIGRCVVANVQVAADDHRHLRGEGVDGIHRPSQRDAALNGIDIALQMGGEAEFGLLGQAGQGARGTEPHRGLTRLERLGSIVRGGAREPEQTGINPAREGVEVELDRRGLHVDRHVAAVETGIVGG